MRHLIVIFLMVPGLAAAAPLSVSCPVPLVKESLSTPLTGGWVPPPENDIGYPNPVRQWADYTAIFTGPPQNGDIVLPESSHVGNQSASITWKFPPTSHDLWVGCHYGGLMLVRHLADGTQYCRATIHDADISVQCQ